MPYYKWRGVDLTASYRRGLLFARTQKELEELLLHQNIALLRAYERQAIVSKPISSEQITYFFKQISVLLHSGILLPQALEIVGDQIVHARLQKRVRDITARVIRGISFSSALQEHSAYFLPVMVHMVNVGEQGGCVARAIDALTTYLEIAQQFKKRVRSAAMMPAITLGAFFCISIGVVVIIVPRFAQLFSSMGKELPEITRFLLSASETLQSLWLWGIIGSVLGTTLCLAKLFWLRIKPYKDRLLLKVPIVSEVVLTSSFLYWFNALDMVLRSGVPLASALRIAHPLVQNSVLKAGLASVVEDVERGKTLYFALLRVPGQPFTPDVLALMAVGQESGELAHMIQRAAGIYQIKVDCVLSFCTFIIQPLLLVIIGLLVGFLVFALYMPIFNLAQIG